MKEHIVKHGVTFKMNDVTALCEQKFSVVAEDDWKPLCDRGKRQEVKYCEGNIIIDNKTDRFVISL